MCDKDKKQRYKIIHKIIQEESADHEATRTYLENIIEEQRYERADQVFNTDKTGFW